LAVPFRTESCEEPAESAKEGSRRNFGCFNIETSARSAPLRKRTRSKVSYVGRDYKNLFGVPPQRDIARLRDNLHA